MYFCGPVRGKDVNCEVPIVRAEQIGHCPGVWRDKFFERGLFFFGLYEAMHSDVGGGRLLLYSQIFFTLVVKETSGGHGYTFGPRRVSFLTHA